MKREIYEVYAKAIDANGAYNTLSGYPKVFDSKTYDNNIAITEKRAYGAYYEVLGEMCKRDDRQNQIAMIIRASDGFQVMYNHYGEIADIPEPTYELTVIGGIGGGTYKNSAVVRISADVPEGKQFDHWEGMDGLMQSSGDSTTPTVIFMMPKQNLTITAVYTDIEEPEE